MEKYEWKEGIDGSGITKYGLNAKVNGKNYEIWVKDISSGSFKFNSIIISDKNNRCELEYVNRSKENTVNYLKNMCENILDGRELNKAKSVKEIADIMRDVGKDLKFYHYEEKKDGFDLKYVSHKGKLDIYVRDDRDANNMYFRREDNDIEKAVKDADVALGYIKENGITGGGVWAVATTVFGKGTFGSAGELGGYFKKNDGKREYGKWYEEKDGTESMVYEYGEKGIHVRVSNDGKMYVGELGRKTANPTKYDFHCIHGMSILNINYIYGADNGEDLKGKIEDSLKKHEYKGIYGLEKYIKELPEKRVKSVSCSKILDDMNMMTGYKKIERIREDEYDWDSKKDRKGLALYSAVDDDYNGYYLLCDIDKGKKDGKAYNNSKIFEFKEDFNKVSALHFLEQYKDKQMKKYMKDWAKDAKEKEMKAKGRRGV